MKNTFLFLLIIFSGNTIAEWIFYATGDDATLYWYENKRSIIKKNELYVWERQRFAQNNNMVIQHSTKSAIVHKKINCFERTSQVLEYTLFSDENWKNKTTSSSQPLNKAIIPPKSASDIILNKLCSKRVL